MEFICLDGEYVDPERLRFLRALQYGEGVFETIRIKGGIPEYLDLHLARLKKGARIIGLTVPEGDYESLIRKLLKKNKISGKLARVKIILSNGESPHFCLISEQFHPPDRSNYSNGVKLSTGRHPYCESEVAKIKSTCRLPYMKLKQKAARKRCFDCLLTTYKGEILESTVANLFIWDGEKLCVPPVRSYRLHGIMERVVAKEVKRSGFSVCEKDIKLKGLSSRKGIFLTNSLIGVLPVKAVGNIILRNMTGEPVINNLVSNFSPFKK